MPEFVNVHLAPGRFTTGYYRIDGQTLTMVYHDGTDVEPPVTCQLKSGDNPKAIASVLTKEIRSRMVSSFWDEMKLPGDYVA